MNSVPSRALYLITGWAATASVLWRDDGVIVGFFTIAADLVKREASDYSWLNGLDAGLKAG